MKKIVFLLSVLILFSCSNDEDSVATQPTLVVTSINPSTGPKNTIVTILGNGFSTTTSLNNVTLNNKVCEVINSTSNQLTISIPPSAGSGKINIVVGNATTETNNFEFIVTTTVSTIAGIGVQGFQDGDGITARFDKPFGITIDPQNNLYVTDSGNNRIRKITPQGFVTTIAGSGANGSSNGQSILSEFSFPLGIIHTNDGSLVIVDHDNHKIREISNTGFVSTISGTGIEGFVNGSIFDARYDNPIGVALNSNGDFFVTDSGNRRVRKFIPLGSVSTFAGNGGFSSIDGQGTTASFNSAYGIAIDSQDNLYVSDNSKIRKITPAGLVSTFVGSEILGNSDGQGTAATFKKIEFMVFDQNGNLFIADSQNNNIRKIDPTGLVSTVAGTTSGFGDGNAATAKFFSPRGITIDSQGNLYVADLLNNRIRKISFD